MIEEEQFGEITRIKELVFNRTNEADHASLTGRPCIILDVIDDTSYIMPLTSKQNYLKYPEFNFKIERSELCNIKKLQKIEGAENACLYEIISRNCCFYAPIAQIKPRIYYNFLITLLSLDLSSYPETYHNFEKIRNDLIMQKKILEERFKAEEQNEIKNLRRVRWLDKKREEQSDLR